MIIARVPGLTVKVLDVPVLPEVLPVQMICCPDCAAVMFMLKVAVPALVVIVSGVAPLSFFANSIFTASEPVAILLPKVSCAWIVTLKPVPAVCCAAMLDIV